MLESFANQILSMVQYFKIYNSLKERQKLHKLVHETLLQDPEFQELHSQFQTKIALGVELIKEGKSRKPPFTNVLMDG